MGDSSGGCLATRLNQKLGEFCSLFVSKDSVQSRYQFKSKGVKLMSSVVKIIQPSGILDGISANQLRREINDVVETGADIVLVDFQDITFMNSTGLGALVSTLRSVRSAGGELFICSLNEQVQMIFQLTKMDRVFKTFTNRDDFEQKVISR
jgi:anti-anti-sigma factor